MTATSNQFFGDLLTELQEVGQALQLAVQERQQKIKKVFGEVMYTASFGEGGRVSAYVPLGKLPEGVNLQEIVEGVIAEIQKRIAEQKSAKEPNEHKGALEAQPVEGQPAQEVEEAATALPAVVVATEKNLKG